MKEVRPFRRPSDVIFLQDNARPHTSKLTKAKLNALKWEVMEHPPYSPDLAPSDYHLFRLLKSKLYDRALKTDELLMEWLEAFFESKSTEFFSEGIRDLLRRWEEVVEAEGAYIVD